MTKSEIQRALLDLPLEEQLEIAADVWDRGAPPETFSLSDEQKRVLDVRLADAKEYPERGVPWTTVKERLFGDL